MSPSEKIKTVKKIAKELDSEEWSLLDLTLRQFKFPTTETFSGSKFDYIIKQLEGGQSEDIRKLAEHLEIDIYNTSSEIKPTFWKDGYLKLFISHLANDKKKAQELKESLEEYSISGFVAHSDIEPTKSWQDEIELGLKTCDCLIALMVKGFHESKWTDQEIGVAIGRDILVIPVRMGEDPYGFIGKFQAIPFHEIDSLSEEIYLSIAKNKKTSKQMGEAIMYKFENSHSYANAKENFELVKQIKYWDEKLIERLIVAKDNNGQIARSWGLSDSITHFISTLNVSR